MEHRSKARSLAIIYEFGAPKKATAHRRIAANLANEVRSTDFKSIREPDKIFYGERALMVLATDAAPSRLR